MGAGKSTVGHALSQRLSVPYIDNDETVAEMAGASTLELAAMTTGLLHEWEARYALSLSERIDRVVAGLPASTADRPEHLDALASHGLLVYLRADVATLAIRVAADPARPWLEGDVSATLADMLASRDPALTASAALVLDATAPVPELVAHIVAAATVGP